MKPSICYLLLYGPIQCKEKEVGGGGRCPRSWPRAVAEAVPAGLKGGPFAQGTCPSLQSMKGSFGVDWNAWFQHSERGHCEAITLLVLFFPRVLNIALHLPTRKSSDPSG